MFLLRFLFEKVGFWFFFDSVFFYGVRISEAEDCGIRFFIDDIFGIWVFGVFD